MEKRQLKIELLGTSFTIQSEENADHLARVSSCLRDKVEEVRSRYTLAAPLTIALLAALNIADDLIREREGKASRGSSSTASQEAETIAASLIERMDDELLSHVPLEEERGS